MGDALDAAPLLAGAHQIDQLDQGHLALEAHDAIDLGNQLQRMLVAEAREMPADGEMAVDAVLTEIAREIGEAADVELEDEGEAHHHRIHPADDVEYLAEVDLEIDDLNEMSAASERRSQIAQAQILLILKADQHDALGGLLAGLHPCL